MTITFCVLSLILGLVIGHDAGYAHRQNDESDEAMEQ